MSVYQAIKLKLSASPGDIIEINGDPIAIEGAEGAAINYELLNFTQQFELKSKDSCEVQLKSDLSSLGSEGYISLPIRAFDLADSSKEAFATLEVPFQVDRYPPIFDEDSYFSTINGTKFDTEIALNIEPHDIKAIDGDADIDAKILYSLPSQNCMITDKYSNMLDIEMLADNIL